MAANKPQKSHDQRLFTILWTWLSIRTLLPWLVFFRLTFEGPGYTWGTSYFGKTFHSSGLARADFLLVYALLAIGIFLLYQLRKFNFRLAAPAIFACLALFAADAVYELAQGEPLIFQGDTLGVTLNITWVFVLLQIGMLLLGIAWWIGVAGLATRTGPPAMDNRRRWIVRACIVFVPLQLLLLIGGEPHGLTDKIGVIGTLLQGALLAYAFYPGSDYRA